ncbi:MAG: DUF1501 domain-containing protein [Stellaceae bacterium]
MANRDPVVVVLQLTGGNDYLNTVIPYNNPLYRENRPAVGIPDNNIIHLDQQYGIPDYMAPMKKFWDEGKLAICHGVGWKESPRSHFRAMDIWHTCEPIKVGTEGWLGRVAREFDPRKENVVTTVSMGPSLPRSLVCPGVPVACVAGTLDKYGFLPTIQGSQRTQVLDRFARMYSPAIGSGPVMDYLSETATDSLKGEDIIKTAPQKYKSTIEYPKTPIAQKLRNIAQVHCADLGTRILYCDHSTFDTHAGQAPGHAALWKAVSEGLDSFVQDLRAQNHYDNVVILLFSEFGRRVHDNGSGTDHGAGGVAFAIGEKVKGGHYGEMPSLKAEHLVQGDLNPNMDFRSVYSTILDKWLKLNPAPIVNGTYEQPAFLN